MAVKSLFSATSLLAAFGMVLAPSGPGPGTTAQAGCPCNAGIPYAGAPSDLEMPAMLPHSFSPPAYQSPPPIAVAQPVERPPGTLGYTYKLKSNPVPVDDHPRTAKLQVRNASNLELRLEGIQKFKHLRGDDGIWYFESDAPLLPGNPQIYKLRVKSYDGPSGPIYGQEYYVRMIPGRIVYYSF